jgi:transposase
MPKDVTPGKPTTRRYSPEEKAAAVRMVRTLRAELGTEQATIKRVARQLGYGTESVRLWVNQADIDEGGKPGVTTTDGQRLADLERENRELRRANHILKTASAFFAAELCATRRCVYRGAVRDRPLRVVVAA